MYMCVCMCVYVCVSVCVHVCVHVCMCVCVHVYFVYMCMCMFLCESCAQRGFNQSVLRKSGCVICGIGRRCSQLDRNLTWLYSP